MSESPHTRVPFFFGVQTNVGERLGLLIYPVRLTNVPTKNRPKGEHHAQVKFGNPSQWRSEVHPIAFDVAGVDTTLFLGINATERRFVGLDPALWNPMPLGVSFYAADGDFHEMGAEGWHAWEVDTRGGARNEARTPEGFESRVAFTPERFLDFARFERRASELGLDTALRVKLGQQFRDRSFADRAARSTHPLEEQFGLDAARILDLIAERRMLTTAVKGGVAEAHLEEQMSVHPSIERITRRTDDRSADFDVQLKDGRAYVVECKNVSPSLLADGTVQVETQRTRNSKNDPTARLYRVDAFDVVAACLFSVTGSWTFKFVRTSQLTEHSKYPGFLATKQQVDDRWRDTIEELGH
ncbi:hypothetical protein SAMN04489807_0135 [Microbacterium hydrocarbonoxydans]|uniref:Methylase-associated X1 domain-containing protein n=1 Tax=Microbacterium hydrocarbonoxydans TaxID=273678 RepID=A0A1H4IPS2_9MICO|nr:hypothetical protein SAMN04489807_0135 [Microbacterium hydrocarbonoxydans]